MLAIARHENFYNDDGESTLVHKEHRLNPHDLAVNTEERKLFVMFGNHESVLGRRIERRGSYL